MAEPITTRDQWIEQCAARFKWAGCNDFSAKDCAIGEFNYRCREEPTDDAPEQPPDRWPDPTEAADDAMREWENDGVYIGHKPDQPAASSAIAGVGAAPAVEPHLNLCATCGGSGYVGDDADDCATCQDATAGVRVDAPTALPVLPVDDQPRPEDPLAPSWEGFTRPRPKLLRLCTINWSSSGWPDEGRGVWRIEGFAELGERTERFTLRRIAPALPGGPSGETISFYRASYESGGLTIWRKGTELADPAYGVAPVEGKSNG